MRGPPSRGGPPRPAAAAASPGGHLPFESGGVLGRGGMGEVRIAWDPRLERDVALKCALPGDPDSARRLAREAVLTAGLTHPGIMPVYEAGRTPDGRPWYAMRLFNGHTLAQAIATADGPEARLRLVRHVLDAALAVAYAHGQGVLHRDLKPANVLTGEFGETIVADWGLACRIEEGAAEGPRIGTPRYMSPEQHAGEALDPRADVYSLGAILAEVLTGSPPPRGGPLSPPQGIPAELLAIAERALRAVPAERYDSARAFADDLLAWFEGRRVAAHPYSARELLLRTLRAWRTPLLVGAAGLIAVAVAVGIGWARTAQQRDRAAASEVAAAAARDEERRAFAVALQAQASVAVARGLAMEAEVLATQALQRHESPDARGVLAAVHGRPRWTLRAARPAPRCTGRMLSADGARAVCLEGDRALVDAADGAGKEEAVAGSWARASFAGDAEHLVLLDTSSRVWAWTLGQAPALLGEFASLWGALPRSPQPGLQAIRGTAGELRIDVTSGTLRATETCRAARTVQTVSIDHGGGLLVGCANGLLRRVSTSGEARDLHALAPEDGLASVLHAMDGDHVLVGTVNGHGLLLDPDDGVLLRRRFGDEAVFAVEPQGERVALSLASGDLVIWDLAADVEQARFRDLGLTAAWVDGGQILRTLGERYEDREAPPTRYPHQLRVDAGVSVLAWSPDGTRLAAGDGSGVTTLIEPRSGRVLHRLHADDAVVKDLAFSPDGRSVFVASAGLEQRAWWVDTGLQRYADRGMKLRRVAWLATAGPILVPYSVDLYQVPGDLDGPPQPLAHPGLHDIEVAPDARRAAGVTPDHALWVAEDGPTPTWRPLATLPASTAIAIGGEGIYASTDDALLRFAPSGEETWRVPLARGTTDLAVSPDERWAAVGRLDGTVEVYAVGAPALRARLRGHGARVAALAFSPDGQWLASGGWDQQVRLWSMASLDADAATLGAEAEAGWGRDLDAVLATMGTVSPP